LHCYLRTLALLTITVAFSAPASAQSSTAVGVGAGAATGAVVAGPVGAVVGGVAGGVIGHSMERRHNQTGGTCAGKRVVAAWYESGRRTASGQAFNPGGNTAAHRTLPFGSRVMVSNPQNGKSVTVVINDRGPYSRGVTLDLARGAADAIGMHQTQWVCMFQS
jgi:rare lipoprotein A